MDKIYLVVVFGGDDIDSKNYGIVGDKYFLECIGAYLIKDIAIKRKNDFIKKYGEGDLYNDDNVRIIEIPIDTDIDYGNLEIFNVMIPY